MRPAHGPCLLLLGLSSLQAQAAPQEPSVDMLVPIQGQPLQGKITSIGSDGLIRLTLSDGKTKHISLSDLQSLQLRQVAAGNLPRRGYVLLRSGLRLPATVKSITSGKVVLETPIANAQLTFAMRHVQGILFAKLEVERDAGYARYIIAPKEDKDLLYFRGSEKILQRTVTVLGFEDGKVLYEARGRKRHKPIADLYGLVMARGSGARPDVLPRPWVQLQLRSGLTVPGKLLSMDDSECVLRLAEKVDLHLHRNLVLGMEVKSDRLVYLTELEPVETKQTPAFDKARPWLKNRSPSGDGIMIGGSKPRKAKNGLVLFPRTKLTFELGGKFDSFETTICIEGRSTGPAHAIFRVRAGDKLLFESKPFTRESEPLELKLPLSNQKRLSIEADFGENFDFGDHCVFAEARLIKQGS